MLGWVARRRAPIVDAAGLAVFLLVLLDYLRPSLLLLPTVAAGGDTPRHYPPLVYFHDHLLPRLRLQGWYPGAYPRVAAVLLALTALAHGYAVLWAGLSATYFLYASRRPARTLRWLAAVGGLAFALAALWLVPLLADWGWTTPYDDPWITVSA